MLLPWLWGYTCVWRLETWRVCCNTVITLTHDSGRCLHIFLMFLGSPLYILQDVLFGKVHHVGYYTPVCYNMPPCTVSVMLRYLMIIKLRDILWENLLGLSTPFQVRHTRDYYTNNKKKWNYKCERSKFDRRILLQKKDTRIQRITLSTLLYVNNCTTIIRCGRRIRTQ